jgi:hypothetical protein
MQAFRLIGPKPLINTGFSRFTVAGQHWVFTSFPCKKQLRSIERSITITPRSGLPEQHAKTPKKLQKINRFQLCKEM